MPETFEKFRADFEAYMGEPWGGMTEVDGLGRYAWTDGRILQAMSGGGTLVTVNLAYKMDRSEDARRRLAQHVLGRL